MAFVKLQFTPGVNRDTTNYTGEGGWWECDKIRFRSGYPQKLGGWEKASPTNFYGACRQMWNYTTTYSDEFLVMGTNSKVYIEVGAVLFDITPLRATSPTMITPNSDNCINTSSGLTTVTVSLAAAHSLTTGDFVTISGVAGASIGGIPIAEINTNVQVTVTSGTAFTFQSTTAATSNTTNQGGTSIVLSFEITPGYQITTFGYGWGTSTWSRGTWGTGSTVPVSLPQRDWWLGNFDNDLFMNIRNGAPYYWARGMTADPTTALATRAITLQAKATADGYTAASVPVAVGQLALSQQDQHLVAFGAVPYGSTSVADFDPMLIRWADQANPGQWTPAVTNSAGDLRVSRGSGIVRAMPARQEFLVWTDSTLYALQFLGTSDVFGLQEYADNISVMSPRSMASAANITYWMGQDKFYAYTGRVETLPCTLREHVFSNINLNQTDQVICGTNEQWNEVWWFYPSASSDYNDSYVVYQHLEKIWYYGSLERTAWLDTPLRHYPAAANSPAGAARGYLYQHEFGVDDDGAALTAYIQSNDFDMGDGEQFMLSRRLIPDINFDGSEPTVTPEATFEIRPRNFPGTSYQSDPEDEQRVIETTVDSYTGQVFIRARARQMAIKVMSENLGVTWQLGSPRIQVRVDGKR
jgi:hypothetical protein